MSGKIEKCPTCGSDVRIVGKTTMYYEPVVPAEMSEEEILKAAREHSAYGDGSMYDRKLMDQFTSGVYWVLHRLGLAHPDPTDTGRLTLATQSPLPGASTLIEFPGVGTVNYKRKSWIEHIKEWYEMNNFNEAQKDVLQLVDEIDRLEAERLTLPTQSPPLVLADEVEEIWETLDTKYRALANRNWENIKNAQSHVVSLVAQAVSETVRSVTKRLTLTTEAETPAERNYTRNIEAHNRHLQAVLDKRKARIKELEAELKAARDEVEQHQRIDYWFERGKAAEKECDRLKERVGELESEITNSNKFAQDQENRNVRLSGLLIEALSSLDHFGESVSLRSDIRKALKGGGDE